MSRTVRLVVVVLSSTLAAACGTAASAARCLGDACEPIAVDAGDTVAGDASSDTAEADDAEVDDGADAGTDPDLGDAATDGDGAADDTGGTIHCDGEDRNACGGCGPLLVDPGAACGPCLDGVWECQGTGQHKAKTRSPEPDVPKVWLYPLTLPAVPPPVVKQAWLFLR